MSGFSTSNEMRSGFLPDRIIHLHPTRLCNLACLHCYSDSGPWQKSALALEPIIKALPFLKSQGYKLISISGGEPLTYPHLLPLIDEAIANDFRITMISNGLFPKKKLERIAPKLHGMAISFDGYQKMHNHLRGKENAFEQASNTLRWLSDQGYPMAAAISLTPPAISELPELADHLVGLGASALQIRPVALAGRARSMADLRPFTEADMARLYLVAIALAQELADQVAVQCDLAPVREIWNNREAYQSLLSSCELSGTKFQNQLLADLVNPLVITETGILKPIAYDFNSGFNIASLSTLSSETLSVYKQQGLEKFQKFLGSTLLTLEGKDGLIDWFDYCTRRSEQEISTPLKINNHARKKEKRIQSISNGLTSTSEV